MEKLIDLLKRSFELWAKKRWLIEIDRAIERYRKIRLKANRQHYVMYALIKRYNELYNENVGVTDNG